MRFAGASTGVLPAASSRETRAGASAAVLLDVNGAPFQHDDPPERALLIAEGDAGGLHAGGKAFGHLPKSGETVVIDRFEFRVIRADSRKIRLLAVRLEPDEE